MKRVLIGIFILVSFSLRAQDFTNLELQFFEAIEFGNFTQAHQLINDITKPNLKKELYNYWKAYYHCDFSTNELSTKNLILEEKIINLLNFSITLYRENGEILEAYKALRQALTLSETHNLKLYTYLSCKLILDIYSNSNLGSNDISYRYVLNKMKSNATTVWQENLVDIYDFKITMRHFYKDSISSIRTKFNALTPLAKSENNLITGKLKIDLGNFHNKISHNVDSSNFYYNEAEKFFHKGISHTEKDVFAKLQYSKAALKLQEQKPIESLNILNDIQIDTSGFYHNNILIYINLYKHLSYKALGDTQNALIFENKYLSHQISINESEKLQLISDLETKYETAEKEKQILIERQKKKQNQNIAIGLAGSLGLGSIIAFLLFKNTKRKQKLAEQEKAIETQKLTNVLKEQELMAIDAMIEGQEKERLRIANDLHDDLGGLMATVKLHLSSLKKNAPQDDFNRTNTLLDEAYQKIRQIAHTKNSGVIAKQGLLKAIQKMAQMISASNKLHIEVIDYGLDSRLENSLELSVFRMVQELVTNIIKHAEATEASIHLTQHETALNIMIEDNGKGFNTTTKLNENDGMGLHSIDKRVSHLDGTFTIESNPKEGTTIIIDIPI